MTNNLECLRVIYYRHPTAFKGSIRLTLHLKISCYILPASKFLATDFSCVGSAVLIYTSNLFCSLKRDIRPLLQPVECSPSRN